jgi:hypothetical protein
VNALRARSPARSSRSPSSADFTTTTAPPHDDGGWAKRTARVIYQASLPAAANHEEASELLLSLVDVIRYANSADLEARVWSYFLTYAHR